MKKTNGLNKQSARYILLGVSIVALVAALIAALPQRALADNETPPPVPADLQVPAGSKLILVGHATGTQNYICLPSGSGFAWAFFGPQATLFDSENEQVTTHYLSANPSENGTLRPTWQHSRDSSTVWAAAVASSSDPLYVAPGAIPWLKLEKRGTQAGPTGGDRLTATTYIQRLNTSGGVAPATGCSVATNVGNKAFVPYTADYFFYKQTGQ